MALDIPKWLKEDMGFSEQEIVDNKLVALYTPRAEKIERGYLAQSDYSRKMDKLNADVKTQLDDLAAAQSRLDVEIVEWAGVQARGKTVTEKMQADFDAAQADVLRLQQTVRKVATDAGLDPEKVLAGVEVKAPVKVDLPSPIDTSKFVSVEQYQALANMALTLPAELAALAHEHHELTGEWLDPRVVIDEVKSRASVKGNTKSLEARAIWEEKYGIPDKRTAKSKKDHDEEIAAAEKRGAERALTEQALPGGPAQGKHAPIFAKAGGRESVLKRPQPGEGLQSAVAALRSGKYRGDQKTA